jgi:hypothetical protein
VGDLISRDELDGLQRRYDPARGTRPPFFASLIVEGKTTKSLNGLWGESNGIEVITEVLSDRQHRHHLRDNLGRIAPRFHQAACLCSAKV